MKIDIQSPKQPIKAGLFSLIILYFLLSGFSFFELVHFSKLVSEGSLRIKLLTVFVITILVPVYLIIVEDWIKVQGLRLFFELASVGIIAIFYYLSFDHVEFSKADCSEVVCILTSDITSSLLLSLFKRLYKISKELKKDKPEA